jgi:hypothetical protein
MDFNTPLLIRNVRIEPVRALMRFQVVRLFKKPANKLVRK